MPRGSRGDVLSLGEDWAMTEVVIAEKALRVSSLEMKDWQPTSAYVVIFACIHLWNGCLWKGCHADIGCFSRSGVTSCAMGGFLIDR